MAATIQLDICTPEGKTWLARITGLGGQFGVHRDFINPISKDTSRSGMTGTATFVVTEDGIYQSNEGRRKLGKKWYRVAGDEFTEITEADGIAAVAAGE